MQIWKKIASVIIVLFLITLIGLCVYSIMFLDIGYLVLVLTITILYGANLVVSFYILNNKSRGLNTKMCWIFTLWLLPGIAIILFFLFGTTPFIKRSRREFIKQRQTLDIYQDYRFTNIFLNKKFNDSELITFQAFIHYTMNVNNSPVYSENNIEFIPDTIDLYERSIEIIRSAKKIIYLQYYIIGDGFWLRTIFNELSKKIDEGVEVFLMYDWVGSAMKISNHLLNDLKSKGAHVAVFNPKGFTLFKSKTNFRCHRKVLIVDNERAIYGGSNMSDEYLGMSRRNNYLIDINFIIKGEIVNSLFLAFVSDWEMYTGHSITIPNKKLIKLIIKERDLTSVYSKSTMADNIPRQTKVELQKDNSLATLLMTGPDMKENVASDFLSKAIAMSKKRIWIASPYFYPTIDVLKSIRTASLSGVDVVLLLPGKQDHATFKPLTRSLYHSLLEANVKIYEYGSFNHSKIIIIDDNISIAGTCNLDFRSLWINYETIMPIYSTTLNSNIESWFLDKFSNSRIVDYDFLIKHYKFYDKLKVSFLQIYHPIL